MTIENNKSTFVRLWRELERTRVLFDVQGKRYCVRRILQYWGLVECLEPVCFKSKLLGYDLLPPPENAPLKHRALLIALLSVYLNIGERNVKLKELDAAYLVAFPHATPINVARKRAPDGGP